MKPPAIIDTNVVVAGLIAKDASSAAAQTLDGMLNARFVFVVSPALLAEYHAVLLRPKLRRLHGLSQAQVETLLTELAQHAVVLNPDPTQLTAPDPGDQLLWDLLATRPDWVLVTGDKLLHQTNDMPARVISPRAFVDFRPMQ